jgi:diaminohydroxyphosphoribosylaminopyrimidine deaminase/5-amino-6-(5-phosphoribosylamino)uracil reductase
MIISAHDDVMIVGTSAAAPARRKMLENLGIQVFIADGLAGRTDPRKVIEHLARERYLSLMVEGGSKVNWTMLDRGIADKVLFYYAPKILGGLKSVPVAGGQGRMRRADAILMHRVSVHPISTDEFLVEAYVVKN